MPPMMLFVGVGKESRPACAGDFKAMREGAGAWPLGLGANAFPLHLAEISGPGTPIA